MTSPNEMKLPQQATYDGLTPPFTPATATFPNAETTQDQTQYDSDVLGSATATDISSSDPNIPEQKIDDEDTTESSKPTGNETSKEEGEGTDNEDSSVCLPDRFNKLLDNHPIKNSVRLDSDVAFI